MRRLTRFFAAALPCLIGVATVCDARPASQRQAIAQAARNAYYAPLTLPSGLTAPQAVYSVIRTASWTGSCLKVRRDSDNATQVIGFTPTNVCDFATADRFAGGANLYVVTWYDQSGNGNDLTQTNTTLQPTFSPGNEWQAIRPVSIFSTLQQTPQLWIGGALSGSMTANNMSVYTVMVPRLSQSQAYYWEGCTGNPCTSTSSNMASTGAFSFGLSPSPVWLISTTNPNPAAIMGVYSYSAASAAAGAAAVFRGQIQASDDATLQTLKVTTYTSGTISAGSAIQGFSAGLYITGQITPNSGGFTGETAGGVGRYTITNPMKATVAVNTVLATQTVAQEARLAGLDYFTSALPGTGAVSGFFLGSHYTGTSYPAMADYYAVVVYPSTHTPVQMMAVEAPLARSFQTVPLSAYTKNLQYNGSSLITSNFATNGQQIAFQEGFGRDASHSNVAAWRMVVTAVGGRQLMVEADTPNGPGWFKQYLAAASYPNITKQVYVMDAPSNDIGAAVSQANLLPTFCSSTCTATNYGGWGTSARFYGTITNSCTVTISSLFGTVTPGQPLYSLGTTLNNAVLASTKYTLGTLISGSNYNVTSSDSTCASADSGYFSQTGTATAAQADAWADQLYSTITVPFVSGLRGTGWKVVVPTIIARGDLGTGLTPAYLNGPGSNFAEEVRLRYNADVRAGANGTVTSLNPSGVPYAVSDRANAGGLGSIFNTPAGTSNHTYYWTDNTHLTNLGYGIIGTADKAAILSQ